MHRHSISLDQVRQDAEAAASRLFADSSISPGVALLLALGEEYSKLVARAVPSIPRELVQGIEAFLRWQTLEETQNSDAVWVCLTDALATIVTTGAPDADRLAAEGRRLERAPVWALARWDERCAAKILALDEPDREGWLKACETAPAAPDHDQQPSEETVAVSVTPYRAAWRIEDRFQIWDENVVAASWLAEHAPLRILRHADPARWFRAIDRWEDPRLVQGALSSQGLREAPSTVVDLLRVASPAFDDRGTPTGRSAALVLCQIAIGCAEELLRVGANAATRSGVVAPLLDAFIGALLDRSDGVRLGTALLTWLFDAVVLRQRSKADTSTAGEARRMLLDKLSLSLSRRRFPVEQYRAFAAERRALSTKRVSLWQRELPALLACSRTLEGTSQEDRDVQRAWLRALLLVSREWSHAKADTLTRELVAGCLDGDAPAALCKELFEELEPKRRRAEFVRSRYLAEGQNDALPSLILLASLVWMVENDRSNDPSNDLVYVRDRALRIALTDAWTGSSELRPRDVIVRAIVVAIEKFGVADMKTIDLVSPMAHELHVLGPVLIHISDGLGSAARDRLLMALGGTFDDMRRTAVEWAHVTGMLEDVALAKALQEMPENTSS
jgi:hypothetical protein